MPKVVSYTPAWLSKPNPGHDIFTSATATAASLPAGLSNGYGSKTKKSQKPGPRRTIARRGTEVFVAVGKEIRWADLVYLKEAWEDGQSRRSGKSKEKDSRDNQYTQDRAQGYRTLKVPVAEDIRQLIISPHSNYLAILTTHTVHIGIIPESSALTSSDTGRIRIKTYTIGPTTHVTTQAGIASAIWHPLGVNGTCLVTVTEDAMVRVWEISTTDHFTFDRPSLAIDLKKLADGTSIDQDFTAPAVAKNKGFSPDTIEMEVASACFAERGSGGWSPMTLWIAMREGDVYALCPLLPNKWSPPPTLVPSLSVSIVAQIAAIEDDLEVPQSDKLLAQQHLAWMSDIDAQEPMLVESVSGGESLEVYTRPSKPGKIPKLQGPFILELAPEESDDPLDSLLSDIYVIGPKIDAHQLMLGEEEEELDFDDEEQGGLSFGVVCLMTSSGRLSISLDLDGVEAQWLPKAKSRFQHLDDTDPPALLTFQVLDTTKSGEVWEGSWPMFSIDVTSKYSFYITDTSSVTFISLSPWVFRLETEMSEGAIGTDFRLDLLVNSQSTIRERIHTQKLDDHSSPPLSASVLFQDPDLGYVLLTSTPYGPIALAFEEPEDDFDPSLRSQSSAYDSETEKPLVLVEPRFAYEPTHELDISSALPDLLEKFRHSKYKRLMKEDVRLSPATLTIMTDVHKTLSEETHRLGNAAAELFRRCDLLQTELRNQIQQANDLAARVDAVTGEDSEDGPVKSTNERLEERIESARKRQQDLTERLEKMRRKVAKGGCRELSDKEKAWVEEVGTMAATVLGEGDLNESVMRRTKQPYERYYEVQQLKEDLLEQVEELATEDHTTNSQGVKVPTEIRKAKVAQIMSLLERETALVEGAKTRLENLSLSG